MERSWIERNRDTYHTIYGFVKYDGLPGNIIEVCNVDHILS
jgi:hypothetical protein